MGATHRSSRDELLTGDDPPERIGRWRLEARLGAGRFGTVWRARDNTGRLAAIKLLSASPGDEIRALARVHHPAIVEAIGAGSVPVPHVAMSLAPGLPLSRAGSLPPREAIRILAVLADALAAVAAAGIAHGDLKADNVLLDRDSGRVTLVDFGLAGGTGGTPRYAAPERLGGGLASAAADVYALGLLAWELLVERLPWPDEDLLGRLSAPPRLAAAPEWLGELIGSMLSPDPSQRPSAAAAADVFEANGIALPIRTADQVERRARTVRVARPGIDPIVARWLAEGKLLALVGPVGSGRSSALAHAGIELAARGIPYVAIGGSAEPWAAVEAALLDPALPGPSVELPRAPDLPTRADAAAEALAARAVGEDGTGRLVMLVDDWDHIDEGSRATVYAAARQGAAILAAGRDAPEGFRVVSLPPFGAGRTRELLSAVLGTSDPEVARITRAIAGGWPGDIVRFTVAAVAAGALVWRRRAWVADIDRLERVEIARSEPAGQPQLEDLGEAARVLAATIALAQPIERSEALEISGASPDALGVLMERGLVRGDPWLLWSASAPPTIADEAALCRALRDRWLARDPIPYARLGRVLVGARQPEIAVLHGSAAVRAALEIDLERAVSLADALWSASPIPELAAARIGALVRAGRITEARAAGRDALAGRDLGREDIPVLIALANLEDTSSEDPSAMLVQIDRAAALARAAGETEPPELDLIRARALYRAGELVPAAEAAQRVYAPERPVPTPTRLSALGLLAQITAASDGAAAGLAVLDLAVDDTGSGTAEHALIDGIRGRLLWHDGQPREAAAAMEAAAAARRALPTVDRARLENNAGLCWYSVGDLERAVADWERALLGFERIGAAREVIRVEVNLCQGYRELGRWRRAEEVGNRAVQGARACGSAAFEATALGNLGDVALWQRKLTRASELYDAAEALAVGEALASERLELARRRAEVAALRRDPDALERAAHAETAAREAGADTEIGRCCAVRSLVLASRGQAAEAAEAAEAALGILRRLGASGELAIARLWVGEAGLASGRRDLAISEAEAALRFADEFARPPLRTWAEQILSRARPDPAVSRVERLTQLAVRVARHHELDEILGELAVAAVELVDAERAFVLLCDEGGPRIAARAGQGSGSPSMSVVRRALSTGREVVATDIEERADLRDKASVVAMHLQAALCVPLVIDGEPAGALYLDSRAQPVGDLGETTTLVRALAAHASIALRNARLRAERTQHADHVREVAHDLRNPLTGILLLASDALDGGGPIGLEDARMVLDAVRHALDLVDRTLGTAETSPPAPVALSDALIGWLGPMAVRARRMGIDLWIEADAQGSVFGSASDLRRVVNNLVGNALKYTAPGGRIEVRTRQEGLELVLDVADTGPGIPAASLPHVFERGYQAVGAVPGQGLGLAIVRQIVEAHGGSVLAANRPQGGAVLTCRFPVDRS